MLDLSIADSVLNYFISVTLVSTYWLNRFFLIPVIMYSTLFELLESEVLIHKNMFPINSNVCLRTRLV